MEYNRSGACAVFSLQYEGLPVLLHVDASSPKFPEEQPSLSLTNVRCAVEKREDHHSVLMATSCKQASRLRKRGLLGVQRSSLESQMGGAGASEPDLQLCQGQAAGVLAVAYDHDLGDGGCGRSRLMPAAYGGSGSCIRGGPHAQLQLRVARAHKSKSNLLEDFVRISRLPRILFRMLASLPGKGAPRSAALESALQRAEQRSRAIVSHGIIVAPETEWLGWRTDLDENYTRGRLLGSSAFGQVFLGTHNERRVRDTPRYLLFASQFRPGSLCALPDAQWCSGGCENDAKGEDLQPPTRACVSTFRPSLVRPAPG